ncbi:MAG: ABC transporter ATP-binding protein [Clostridia bacterium]|nr:ABC transporter ATP-binding protein [Clostridia bacterium]
MKKSSAVKWIYRRTKCVLPHIVIISLINIFVSVLLILLASVSKSVIDASGDLTVFHKGITIAFLVLLQLLLTFVNSQINARANGKLIISLRNKIFTELIHKKYSDTEKLHSGDILNRMTGDVGIIASGVITLIPSVCSMVTKIAVAVYALLAVNLTVGIIIVFLGIVLPLCARIFGKKYKQLSKSVQVTEGNSRSFISECLENSVVIKTFSSEEPITEKMNAYLTENFKFKIKHNFFKSVVNTFMHGAFTLGYYAVIIWAVVAGLSYGTLYYLLQLITILRAPLQNVSGIIPKYYSMIASAERLIELEELADEPPLIKEDKLKALKDNLSGISIKNLTFSYGDEVILEDCNLELHAGKLSVITGESGSGKSTLFKLLLGLYTQNSGFISFNDGTAIDATTRKMFAFVPQGNMLLSGTIKDNITLCNTHIAEEQIEKAARIAEIYEFIKSLPNGFDTVLSERGVGLSEGQIQRIAIARALLSDAPILLLDEATSALDEQLEEAVLNNIKSLTDKTVIFITHRAKPTDVSDATFHLEDKKFKQSK